MCLHLDAASARKLLEDRCDARFKLNPEKAPPVTFKAYSALDVQQDLQNELKKFVVQWGEDRINQEFIASGDRNPSLESFTSPYMILIDNLHNFPDARIMLMRDRKTEELLGCIM